MRSSAILAVALLASVGPAFSAPAYTQPLKRDTASGPSYPINPESGAFSLEDAKNVASIGSSIVSVFHNLFGGDKQSREFVELLTRAVEDDASGAFGLEDAKNIASIGSSIVSAFHNIFGGNSNNRRNEMLAELLARAEVDESGALKLPSLGTIGTIFSVGAPIVSGIIDHFKNKGNDQQQNQARELEALLFARDGGDNSEAISFSTIKNIGSIAGDAFSIFHNLFGGSSDSQQQQRREFVELITRQVSQPTDDSEAISFSTIKNIGSIAGDAFSIIHNLFGGSGDSQQQQQQRRELLELLTRDVSSDESGAISLKTLGGIASVGIPIISGIIDHFTGKGDDNSNQSRELAELLSRSLSDGRPISFILPHSRAPLPAGSLNRLD